MKTNRITSLFAYYACCTSNQAYADRAKNILLKNLCLFGEDGCASCTYFYLDRVNGKKRFWGSDGK